MTFLKQHLHDDNYNWTTELEESNVPSRKRFDRYNGNQLLHIINCFGEKIGKLSLSDGLRIEKLIKSELPLEAKSELSVFNWIQEKYLYSWS